MGRKYFNRIVSWLVLIAILTGFSFYLRSLIINPLDEQITGLEQEIRNLQFQVNRLQGQINRYSEQVLLDDGLIQQRLPHLNFEDEFERSQLLNNIKRDYIERPITFSKGRLIQHHINTSTDTFPEHIDLSNSIHSIQIRANIHFDDEAQIYHYLQELSNTIVSIYIKDIYFELPSENDILEEKEFIYELQITYYMFYYSNR